MSNTITKLGAEKVTYVHTDNHGIVSLEAYEFAQKILDEVTEKIKGFIHHHEFADNKCKSCAVLNLINTGLDELIL